MINQCSNTFISKKMSYCLRHNPAKYGLKLDEYGFVDLQDFNEPHASFST
ncbi:RNA 2'-phosphotransferase [Lactobacillus helveticus]